MRADDLSTDEQQHVRAALRFLRARLGGLQGLSRALRFKASRVRHALSDEPVTAAIAFRAARLADVGIDDLLAGAYPPAGACPTCGHVSETTDVQ